MKTFTFIIAMLALSCLNEAFGQWTTSGSNIYNTNSGFVGIGNSSPTTLLHVAKSMTEPAITVQNLGGSGGATYTMIDALSGANWKFKVTNTGGFKIRDHANLLDVFVIEPNSAANAIYINGVGNAGIGTATPGAKLDVAGHIWQTSTGHSVFLGEYAGSSDDLSDNRNVFIGNHAGYLNSSGEMNTAIGYFTLFTNTTGSNNTANGYYSLYLNTGDGNTANGYTALISNTSGSYNTANGYSTLGANSSGSYNIANGFQSMYSNSSGDNNTANGSHSLYTNTTGSSNTALGYYADVASGDLTNATAIGSNAMVGTSNSIVLGSIAGINGATESVNVGIGTTNPAASASLDITSTSKGFLPPRMNHMERNAIISPAAGLIIWCTTCGVSGELQVYNGTAWTNMVGGPATPGGIGDIYQGGIIAYILQPGDPGYIAEEFHGLIAAPSDQGIAGWGCNGTGITGADGTALGTGNQNTTDILNGCSEEGIAARICGELVLNGYSDWYLPSIVELNKLYQNKIAIGGFADDNYWSSSEYHAYYSWYQTFSNGNQDAHFKYNAGSVRAIRAF